MISLHLLGEVLLKHGILLYLIMPELQGYLLADGYSSLAIGSVVEPGFRPPVDTTLISIDADKPGNIKTLDVHLKVSKRIYDSLRLDSVSFYFFFSFSLIEERNRC